MDKLLRTGMIATNVETLMDHSVGMSDHYARPREQDLQKSYLDVVDALTINNSRQIKEVSENQQAHSPTSRQEITCSGFGNSRLTNFSLLNSGSPNSTTLDLRPWSPLRISKHFLFQRILISL